MYYRQFCLLFLFIMFLFFITIVSSDAQKSKPNVSSNQTNTRNQNSKVFNYFTVNKSSYYTGDIIPITGIVANGTNKVANANVILDATKDDKPIYRSSTITDNLGKFRDASLSIPQEGIIKITANLADLNITSAPPLITISVSKALWSLYLIIIMIAIAFAFIILGSYKEEKFAIVGAIISVAIGYY